MVENKNLLNEDKVCASQLAKKAYYVMAISVAVGICYKSIDYLNPDFSQGFLSDKANIFYLYRWALYAHIVGAPLAFFSGILQVCFPKNRHHRAIGSVYVFSVLLLAAPAGLVMSFYAIGGGWGTLNFALLSVLWGGYTCKAYQVAQQNDRQQHLRFIIGSFLLTQSAILLRVFSYINNQIGFLTGAESYLLVSALSWLPSLVVYEIWWMLRKQRKAKQHVTTPPH